MTENKRTNKKEKIISAAIAVVANHGPEGASIRAIASLAGVSEGAIYKHFPSKEGLIQFIYQRIVEEMVQTKEEISKGPGSLREKLDKWVGVTFDYYDQQPDAFILLYLTPHRFETVDPATMTRQGEMIKEMIMEAQTKGEVRALEPELALSHFIGIELSVPRLINEGRLSPPAGKYVSEVVDAVMRVLST